MAYRNSFSTSAEEAQSMQEVEEALADFNRGNKKADTSSSKKDSPSGKTNVDVNAQDSAAGGAISGAVSGGMIAGPKGALIGAAAGGIAGGLKGRAAAKKENERRRQEQKKQFLDTLHSSLSQHQNALSSGQQERARAASLLR